MNDYPALLQKYLLYIGAAALTLAVYTYPAIKTTAVTGLRIVPPATAPDLSLYLNISAMKTTASGQFVDPYYGVTVPNARMGYSKFRLAFILFGQLRRLLSGNLWWSLMIWNLFWWAALCVLAWWFFQTFLPDRSPEIVLLGLAILMFFNFGILRNCLAAWTHLPSLRGFRDVELPYIRPFFPQAPIPLLLLYLGLQIKALQERNWWTWAAMAVIQFVEFMIFPYATLMMIGITSISLAGILLKRKPLFPWASVLLYGIACGVCDLLFFLHGSGVARTGTTGQYSLMHINLSVLPHRMGGMSVLLAALTAAVCFIRDLGPEIKWPLAALGVTNYLLLLGDVFFSETLLQMSVHAGYFVHFSSSMLVIFLLATAMRFFNPRSPRWRFVAIAGIGWLVLNGVLIAQGTYLTFMPQNREDADLARALLAYPPKAGDLVIARAGVVDDDCAWVSLVTESHVLFCRDAQVLLSPEQNRDTNRFRQAIYLYFTGRDADWVDHAINASAAKELSRLMFLGQATSDSTDRAVGITELKTDLIPRLLSVERREPEVLAFFSQYRQIFVPDNATHPNFILPRLSSYLEIEEQNRIGDMVLFRCKPLPQ